MLDNTYEKELLKNLKREMALTTGDIYSNELARSRKNSRMRFVV